MRIVPGPAGDPRTGGTGRKETVDKLKAGGLQGSEVTRVDTNQPPDLTGRFLTRSQIVLEGFRVIARSLSAGDQPDIAALIKSTRFDGEEVLEAYASELAQIATDRDEQKLARLVANTENNIRALLDGKAVGDLAGNSNSTARDIEKAMGEVVARLQSGENPEVNVSAERVADLLG